MRVLVEDFHVYLDIGEYNIYLSLGGPGDVELDEMNEQLN